jgi:hypothetical protein
MSIESCVFSTPTVRHTCQQRPETGFGMEACEFEEIRDVSNLVPADRVRRGDFQRLQHRHQFGRCKGKTAQHTIRTVITENPDTKMQLLQRRIQNRTWRHCGSIVHLPALRHEIAQRQCALSCIADTKSADQTRSAGWDQFAALTERGRCRKRGEHRARVLELRRHRRDLEQTERIGSRCSDTSSSFVTDAHLETKRRQVLRVANRYQTQPMHKQSLARLQPQAS